MKHLKRISIILAAIILVMGVVTISGMSAQAASETTEAAAEAAADNTTGMKAIAAALAIGIVGFAGAIGMGYSIAKSNEGVARQPEAAGKIQTQLMLGLVFIETAIIYALIVAILIVFVM